MRKFLAIGMLAAGLAGCQSTGTTLTPAQLSTLSCYLLADGTTIAAAFASGGAASTVNKITGITPTVCTAASQVAAVVTTPAQAQAAASAATSGGSVSAAVSATASAGK